MMEGTDDKLSGCIFVERYTGVAGGHGKAAAKKAADAQRSAASAAAKVKREAAAQRARADGASSLADGPYTSDGIVVSYSSGEESSDDEEMVLTARPIERIEVSPAPMMDDFLQPRCDLGAAAGGAASVATPPRTTANTVQSRPPCAATGAKRKAADHRCIECGNASVDAAGANLC